MPLQSCRRFHLRVLFLLLTCLPAWAQATLTTNLALNRPVTASGPLWPGFVVAFITDGTTTSFAHPLADSGTRGFHFQVDLGATYRLDRIVLRNREDGCCPDRLSRFGVELYGDAGGEPGRLNWSANIREDGSDSGVGGADVITADADPSGSFAARFVRVVNRSGAAYNPQLSEIEVFGGLRPVVRTFLAEPDAVAEGEPVTLRWDVAGTTGVFISPGPGTVPTNGSLIVRPATTTTFLLTATNDAGLSTATVTVGVGVTLAPPRITEFVADNDGGYEDEDGDSPDWIEIGNPNAYSYDLTGLFLTDSANNRNRWRFPSVRIPAGGHLVVFTSGKNRTDPTKPLHTNFRLGADGDYLALVARDGVTVLDQHPRGYPRPPEFPPQLSNISYGEGAGGTVGFMRPPTPGQTNGPAFDGIVADPVFSRVHGFADEAFDLTLSTATPGAVIRFTTDASEPSEVRGTVYSGPIRISNTRVVRAAAFRDGWAPTRVVTATYLFPSNVLAAAVMRTSITRNPLYEPRLRSALLDVPSVSLVTPATYNDLREERTSIEWLDPAGGAGFQEDCGVRKFGGAFTDFAKDNFRVYFRAEHGTTKLQYPVFAGLDHGLAPATEFDQLELRGGSHDMVERGFYLSNIFTDDTQLDLGQLGPHGRFIHLYLNGTYWGLYHLRERWGASMHSEYLGGSKDQYESINGNYNVGGWADPGSPYDGDGSIWALAKSLRGNYEQVAPWVDLPHFTDYMLSFLFGGSEEEYRCVGPMVPGSGFKFFLNDADGWLCVPNYCVAGDRTARGAPGRQTGDGPGSLFSMLLKEAHPDFVTLVRDRFHRALTLDGALTPARNAARLLDRTIPIERAFLLESARWGYLTPTEWASRRDHVLQNWFPTRTAQAIATFRSAGIMSPIDAPEAVPHGGTVAAGTRVRFTVPPGAEVFYTLDGSDPRLPGGAVAPDARRHQAGGVAMVLVPTGSRWRWYTDGPGLGSSAVTEGTPTWSAADWKHPAFNDSAWGEGPAQLGYGEGDERTVIPFGPNSASKWITAYFRKRFSVPADATFTSLTLRLLRDDGAVVFLNGREMARSSIRDGAVVGATPADGAPDDGQSFLTIPLSASALRPGENLLAVELHQASPASSDASFDLELSATRSVETTEDPELVLSRSTWIRSRARVGNEWSALDEAFFGIDPLVGPGLLTFAELHYLPEGDVETEFVELANTSGHALNLRGARFTEGIVFAFPDNRDTWVAPGQRLVLVRDLFRFQQRYGRLTPVAGIYSGRLADTGERLVLADAQGTPVAACRFSPAPPWPTAAAGQSASLVLLDPALDPNLPESWRASLVPHGTPGFTDTLPFTGDPIADADHDGVPAILEYVLGTSDADPAVGPGLIQAGPVGGLWFTLSYPRRLGTEDARIRVESSTDLNTWSAAIPLAADPPIDGIRRETWGAPTSGRPTQFLRLRVEW